MKTINDIDLNNKTVLVRVDYNVPIKDGKITDNLRIRASLPTLELLRKKGAKKIVLISHLGRPEGKNVDLTLKPIAKELSKLISNVSFVDEIYGSKVTSATQSLPYISSTKLTFDINFESSFAMGLSVRSTFLPSGRPK